MKKSTPARFNFGGAAIGLGVGAALAAALGPALGIPLGAGLAVVFGLHRARPC